MAMESEIQVTIIVPHYNSPEKLERLLKTIPSNKQLQTIVVDDLSTKGVELYQQIQKKYENHIEFYKNEPSQKSAGGARNIGLRHAKGKWVLFADADDWFLPDFYSVIEPYFASDADMVFFSCTSVIEGTNELSDRHLDKREHVCKYAMQPTRETELWLRYKYYGPISRLIRKEMLEKYQIDFDVVQYSNDLMFSTKCGYYARKIIACPQEIYCITKGEGTLTNNDDPKEDGIRAGVYMRYQWFLCSKLSCSDAALLGYRFWDRVYVYLQVTRNPVLRYMFRIIKQYKRGK